MRSGIELRPRSEAQSICTAWYGRRLYPLCMSVILHHLHVPPMSTLRRPLPRCVTMYQDTAACPALEIVVVEGQQERRRLRRKKT